MDKFDELALFNIAIHLDTLEILRWCKTNKRFNDKICSREPIWIYLLNKEFPKEKDDFLNLSTSPKDLFKLLFSLKKLKEKLNLKHSLLELYNTKSLNLSFNKLGEIPKEIGNLNNLRYLYLHYNLLKELPKEIGNLINLKELYLYNNQLEEIPKEMGNLTNLRILSLENNHLKHLPKEIREMKNLRIYE